AGAAGRGIGGQLVRHARIEDLDVDLHSKGKKGQAAALRRAISATSWGASTSLGARGRSTTPSASPSSIWVSSSPKVWGPILPTSSGTPLRSRLALACFTRSWLSAAKPTQNSAPLLARSLRATVARMSGFSVKASVGGWLPLSFLIFCPDSVAGR